MGIIYCIVVDNIVILCIFAVILSEKKRNYKVRSQKCKNFGSKIFDFSKSDECFFGSKILKILGQKFLIFRSQMSVFLSQKF